MADVQKSNMYNALLYIMLHDGDGLTNKQTNKKLTNSLCLHIIKKTNKSYIYAVTE